MSQPGSEHDDLTSTASIQRALERAVGKALKRKCRLGQYAVIYRDGRTVRLGIDVPWDQDSHSEKADRSPLT